MNSNGNADRGIVIKPHVTDPDAVYYSVQDAMRKLVSNTCTIEQSLNAVAESLQNVLSELEVLQQHHNEVMDERDYVKNLMDVSDKQLAQMFNGVGQWAAQDSVLASDGYTYDRQKLVQYMNECSKTSKQPRSEQDNSVLSAVLTPNRSLKTFLDRLMDVIGSSHKSSVAPDMSMEENARGVGSSGGDANHNNSNGNFGPYGKYTRSSTFANDQAQGYGYHSDDMNCVAVSTQAANTVSNKNKHIYNNTKNGVALAESVTSMTNNSNNAHNDSSNINGNCRRTAMKRYMMDANGTSNGTNSMNNSRRQYNASSTELTINQQGERLHPCLRVYGHCNYRQNCAYAKYPYDACLSYLKGKCRFSDACHERHVEFVKQQPSAGDSSTRQEAIGLAKENSSIPDANNKNNDNSPSSQNAETAA